jgi:hypothetical protein
VDFWRFKSEGCGDAEDAKKLKKAKALQKAKLKK